jgi:hypothetical protein
MGETRNTYQILVRKPVEKLPLGTLREDGRITLRRILKK